MKKLDCYIVSDLRFLLEIQAILPETTSPFLSAQMAVLSSFFQMFIVHGSYKWIIMHEKCGRPDSNGFQLKWRLGTHGHWKNQNPGAHLQKSHSNGSNKGHGQF